MSISMLFKYKYVTKCGFDFDQAHTFAMFSIQQPKPTRNASMSARYDTIHYWKCLVRS